MFGTELVVAGLALALAVAAGLVVHELAHALVLRLFGIDYTLSYLPGRTDGVGGFVTSGPLAVVHPHPTGRDSAHALRVAALAPLSLAAPVFAFGIGGSVPADSPIVLALAVGWLACAIPSPQDFSVVFYAHRVLEAESNATRGSRAD
ncbi:hypothetical protein RBH26_18665 [Natronolimnohabitans sp. A-GB9]|uniref:hypothetical protein n=1 Tax=Natronolimnohabitans sp. A-GB9 TaxID=3069757 RepID=UPI0027B84566|nr:hypothetical protein [Natronolimnohabitans sp. A-GB9]MDQ2052490.1 hypothetical protein [Natronolimnohabitans sp. A-GB9]